MEKDMKLTARTTGQTSTKRSATKCKLTKLTCSNVKPMPGAAAATVFPNFSIKNGVIDLTNPKPSTRTGMPEMNWIAKNSLALQKSFGSVGKLLVLYKDLDPEANEIFSITEGTYSIIEVQPGQWIGMSALHLAKLNCLADFVLILVAVENSAGLVEYINGTLKNYLADSSPDKTLKEAVKLVVGFLQLLGYFCGATDISLNSLTERKKWIEDNIEERDGILDSLLNLQPHPTLDVMLFKLPKEFSDKVQTGAIQPLSLCTDHLYPGECLGLVGYQRYDLIIKQQPTTKVEKTETEEYAATIKCFPGDIKLCDYVHPGKSIGCVRVKASDSLLLYTGTSTEGTSGGPLLDNKGRVVGISVGNYYEYQEEEPPLEKEDAKYPSEPEVYAAERKKELIEYDINSALEREPEKLPLFIDFNVAVSVMHKGLKQMIKCLEAADKKKSQQINSLGMNDQELILYSISPSPSILLRTINGSKSMDAEQQRSQYLIRCKSNFLCSFIANIIVFYQPWQQHQTIYLPQLINDSSAVQVQFSLLLHHQHNLSL
eukprot:TRINITY_DN4185_c0_g1_i1.p1 TRINITY_DN4185_c0_g1~~TRINITY_DN4185_c0_g1_i1.p1  ORF type:complete len:554 (-),score=31.71 TRINITY_DN4185_c0_g1_i1:268-1899(-)